MRREGKTEEGSVLSGDDDDGCVASSSKPLAEKRLGEGIGPILSGG